MRASFASREGWLVGREAVPALSRVSRRTASGRRRARPSAFSVGPGIGPRDGSAAGDGVEPGRLGGRSVEVYNIRKKTLVARPGQDLRRRRAASPRNGALEAYRRPSTTQ